MTRALRAGVVLALALAAALAACAAASNPDRGELEPLQATPEPAPAKPPAQAPAVEPAASARPDPVAAEPGAKAQESAPAPSLVLGRIAGEPVGGAEFLRRLWLDDNAQARRILEQIVFSRLAQLESDRLGIRLHETAVDAALERALQALEKTLADKGSKLTLDQHVQRNLELDPALYRANLRSETIVQMLAERCVRAWLAENERCTIRLTEIRDAQGADLARKELEAGKSFDEVARAHGFGEDEAQRVTAMTVVRSESQELSRLVFATPVGGVGGPHEQNGRWLVFTVVERLPGREGGWSALRTEVEEGLDRAPVSNLEFFQWHAAMVRRYQVEFGPFYEMVEGGSR
jgi:hypothetical protein